MVVKINNFTKSFPMEISIYSYIQDDVRALTL